MKKVFLLFAVIAVLAPCVVASMLFSRTRSRVKEAESLPEEKTFVVEWDVVSANEANIPGLSKTQLIGRIRQSLTKHQTLHSWEAKYRITTHQMPRKIGQETIPEVITSLPIHMISNGDKWFYDEQKMKKDPNGNYAVDSRFVSNGKTISMVWPARQEGQFRSADQPLSIYTPKLADFLPSLPSESLSPKPDFPKVLDILDAPDTKLLPWYTRVGSQICYVLERTTTLRQPFFRSKEELEDWKKSNPEQTEAWSKAARHGIVFNIFPSGAPWANPGKERLIEIKTRLAIAPELDFAIVRWAFGFGSRNGPIRMFVFPYREIEYSDFLKIGEDMLVAKQMVFTKYGIGRQEQRQITHETQLLLDEFAVNRSYNPEFFEVRFPVGYSVMDLDRGISYTVGDSEEKIDALITAAKDRDDFYNKLRSEEAPDLEYSKWINSKPIRLADHKGRPIILHFWGLGCAPCMHELPMLQRLYGHTSEISYDSLFISIHPFVDGDHLKQLEKTIKKKGITFPVMIDSPETEGRFWGKTFRKYGVFSIPTEVKIDEKGYFAEINK